MKLPRFDREVATLTTADESPLFRRVAADAAEIVALARRLEVGDANRYVASDPALEGTDAVRGICREVFAELPVQAGWCYGRGRKMNGVEWHKSSEVVVACNFSRSSSSWVRLLNSPTRIHHHEKRGPA